MLVLSRHIGEKILIGDDVEITVVEIRGDKVRLGVTAPPTVSVDRKEIRLDKIAHGKKGEVPHADS